MSHVTLQHLLTNANHRLEKRLRTESLGVDMNGKDVSPDIHQMAQLMHDLIDGTFRRVVIIIITDSDKT